MFVCMHVCMYNLRVYECWWGRHSHGSRSRFVELSSVCAHRDDRIAHVSNKFLPRVRVRRHDRQVQRRRILIALQPPATFRLRKPV